MLMILVGALLFAVPGLRDVADRLSDVNPWWVVLAVVLELGSCAGYVVAFRTSSTACRRASPRGRAVGDGVRRRPAGRRRGRDRARRLDGQGQGRAGAALHRALGGPVPADERRQRRDPRARRPAGGRRRVPAPHPSLSGLVPGLAAALVLVASGTCRGSPAPGAARHEGRLARWVGHGEGGRRDRAEIRHPELAAAGRRRLPVGRHRDAVGVLPRVRGARRSARSRWRSSSGTSATSSRCPAASGRWTAG